MFIKLTFNVFGEAFNAKESVKYLKSKELNYFYDGDFKNHISFVHPKGNSDDYWDEKYEDEYFSFISKNIDVLVSLGASDFDIFFDIYHYEMEQCNFEILSPKFFHYLEKFNIRLPISIYTIDKNEDPI